MIFLKKIKNQKGIVLLLALLIMAGVTAVGVGISTAILNEIKASRNIDYSMIAYYAAESGTEKGLYTIKANRLNDETLDNTKQAINNESQHYFTEDDPVWSPPAKWLDRKAFDIVEKVATHLDKNQSTTIDLYDPDQFYNPPLEDKIKSIIVYWFNDFEHGYGSEWIEVSWTGWESDGTWINKTKKTLFASSNGGQDGHFTIDLIQSDPLFSDAVFFRVRIKAFFAEVNDLEVKAYNIRDPYNCSGGDPEDCRVDIPSRVVIETTGEYPADSAGSSRQALKVELPWQSPVSGLFDYAFFSEEKIAKELF